MTTTGNVQDELLGAIEQAAAAGRHRDALKLTMQRILRLGLSLLSKGGHVYANDLPDNLSIDRLLALTAEADLDVQRREPDVSPELRTGLLIVQTCLTLQMEASTRADNDPDFGPQTLLRFMALGWLEYFGRSVARGHWDAMAQMAYVKESQSKATKELNARASAWYAEAFAHLAAYRNKHPHAGQQEASIVVAGYLGRTHEALARAVGRNPHKQSYLSMIEALAGGSLTGVDPELISRAKTWADKAPSPKQRPQAARSQTGRQ